MLEVETEAEANLSRPRPRPKFWPRGCLSDRPKLVLCRNGCIFRLNFSRYLISGGSALEQGCYNTQDFGLAPPPELSVEPQRRSYYFRLNVLLRLSDFAILHSLICRVLLLLLLLLTTATA